MRICDFRKKPSKDRGYVMNYFNENKIQASDEAKVQMKHKPYSNYGILRKETNDEQHN